MLLFQAAQLSYVLDDRLKVVLEEVDKEKALKQVVESDLSEKVTELATVEQRLALTERSRGLSEQKAGELQYKLGATETKLAQAESLVSARNQELAYLNGTMKRSEQTFYNMGFTNAENSCSKVVFYARQLRFAEG